MNTNEQTNTTTARIYPSKQVPQPILIDLSSLEGMQEIEQAQRKEHIDLYRLQGW